MIYSRNSCISLWCTKTPLVIENLKWADFVLSSDLNQNFSNYMQDLKILVTQKNAYKWNTTVNIKLAFVFIFFRKIKKYKDKNKRPCSSSLFLEFISQKLRTYSWPQHPDPTDLLPLFYFSHRRLLLEVDIYSRKTTNGLKLN